MARETLHKIRGEIMALIWWGGSAFLAMSLLTHSPADPSFNRSAPGPEAVYNWGGVVGAYISDLLIQAMGWASMVLPLSGVALGWMALRGARYRRGLLRGVGFLLVVLALPPTLEIVGGPQGLGAFKGYEAGGVMGYILGSAILGYLNMGGAVVCLFVSLMGGFMMATQLSFTHAARTARSSAVATARLLLIGAKAIMGVLRGFLRPSPAREARSPSLHREPSVVETKPKAAIPPRPRQRPLPFIPEKALYKTPPLSLLSDPPPPHPSLSPEALRKNARVLGKKLEDFGVSGRVTHVRPGPIVTLYEFEPAPGVKINRIVNLHDDLAMALRAISVRILAPIPGKGAVGIEIPNPHREMVCLKEILSSEEFQGAKHRLTVALGKDTVGRPVVANLATMPHLLIAGATGTGKSVCLNGIIVSILFKASPDEVKFLLVDPKRLELSLYKDIPHLLHPVVMDPKKAAMALLWAVGEMERRYKLMEAVGARNIDQYNRYMESSGYKPEDQPDVGDQKDASPPKRLPYVVIVIDELSDLMMVASRHVEDAVLRLAQMARAAGIHLVVATQRPSVDVLTGTIKINLPVRIAFQVATKFDSRTILDTQGAENLLGAGDMLFLPPGTGRLQRIHGAFISEEEIHRVVQFLKDTWGQSSEVLQILDLPDREEEVSPEEEDEKYDEAVALVSRLRQASVSLIQRHLRIGYNRAARIIEKMEAEGIVGPADGSKPREVLIRSTR